MTRAAPAEGVERFESADFSKEHEHGFCVDLSFGEAFVVAYNEAGYNATYVPLKELIDLIRATPELKHFLDAIKAKK
jgi:aspartyl/asparaginyl beta-hydroxylase (cupin superfamily)